MPRKIKVDFTDVTAYIKCEEGEHIVALREIEEKPSSSGNDMLSVKFEVVKGSCTGAILYDNFVLTQNSLWKLKGYMEMLGLKAAGKTMVDIDQLIGRKCIVSVSHEEYNGSTRARIDNYKALQSKAAPVEEEDDSEYEEEETPAPPVKKPKPKAPPVEEEEYEEEDEEPAPPPKKPKAPPAKTPPAAPPKKPKPKAPPVDDDDDWEDA